MQLQEADKVFNLAAFSGCPPLCFSSVGVSIRSMVFRRHCGPKGTVLGKDYWQWEIKSVKGGSEIAKKVGKRSYKSNDFSERRWLSRREPVFPGWKCQALSWRKNPSISCVLCTGPDQNYNASRTNRTLFPPQNRSWGSQGTPMSLEPRWRGNEIRNRLEI